MKLSKDLSIAEFMPPGIYEMYLDKSVWFIDPRIVTLAQFIRDKFGKSVTMNNYLAGGSYQYLTFRDHTCTIGAENSQHRHGRAVDFWVKLMSPAEIRADIIANFPLYKKVGLTTIEDNTATWVHADCRFTDMDSLLIVPKK
jgi:hypothetical protein